MTKYNMAVKALINLIENDYLPESEYKIRIDEEGHLDSNGAIEFEVYLCKKAKYQPAERKQSDEVLKCTSCGVCTRAIDTHTKVCFECQLKTKE